MSEELQQQGLELRQEISGRVSIWPQQPRAQALRPLFHAWRLAGTAEPWALHFRFSRNDYQNLQYIHCFSLRDRRRVGMRRPPRSRRDSMIVWGPAGGVEPYLELTMAEPSVSESLGHAYRIGDRSYQSRFSDNRLSGRNLVYIAGCSRSGTTLMQRIMRCFACTHVARGERPFTSFLDLDGRPEQSLVVKRDANAWEVLPLLPGAVNLVYCVRHPYDVLTSFHPRARSKNAFYVSPSRWSAEFHAFRQLAADDGVRLLVVRYEDLIADPDQVQQDIADFAGLCPSCRFSQAGEQFSTGSIRKWVNDPSLAEHIGAVRARDGELVDEFLDTFAYDREFCG